MTLANKISLYNRQRKFDYFLRAIKPTDKQTILDVGFCNGDYSIEANFLEKRYPYQYNITALGLEAEGKDSFELSFPNVKVVTYNGKKYPFPDNFFDVGWSNAVVEHVGNREDQIFFIKELLRTCKVVFFTTPNRKFPFDLHTKLPFIHWLPKKLSDQCLIATGNAWASGDYMNLLTKKQIIKICKEAGAKKISIKRNRLLGFTMDFALIVS